MHRLLIYSIAILLLSCQTKINNQSKDTHDKEKAVDTVIVDNAHAEQLNATQMDESADLRKFFASQTNEAHTDFIINTLQYFDSISTDSAMAHFYNVNLPEFKIGIDTLLWNYGIKHNIEEDMLTGKWDEEVGTFFPFLTFAYDNTFDGATAYINFAGLFEKAKATKGNADDTYFEAAIACHGDYVSIYNYRLDEYDADYSHSKLGDGKRTEILKKIIEAGNTSKLFTENLNNLVHTVLYHSAQNGFGYSKEAVKQELDTIIQLQNKTQLDLSEALKMKEMIDTTTTICFDCETKDCRNCY